MIPWLITFNLLCASDAALTHYAITQRGMREVYVPTQNVWVLDGVGAASAVGMDEVILKLRKDHPRIAWSLLISATVVRGLVVAHNIKELTR